MEEKEKNLSRINRYEKRRKSTKLITFLSVSMAVLIVAFIGFFILGGDDNLAQEQRDAAGENAETENGIEKPAEEAAVQPEEIEEKNPEEEQVLEKQLLVSEDPNVREAYTANWQPAGTNQSEPHTVVIKQDTEDWSDMMRAITIATELKEDDMITWWVTSGGKQEVIATVSNKTQTDTYRVYLHWEADKGYRPDKVEVLIKNDQKHR